MPGLHVVPDHLVSSCFEVTEAQRDAAIGNTGRFSLHVGWYWFGQDGPEGPFASKEEAEQDAEKHKET